MAQPKLESEDDAPEEANSEANSEAPTEDEAEVAMTDVGEVGDPDGFFDGVDADPEGDENDTDAGDFFDGKESSSDDSQSSSPDEMLPIANRANATVAKLGVFGLDENEQKDDLHDEFLELAETVQFGTFTEKTVHKHFSEDLDIDPVWGMVGASLILASAVVLKRPDVDTEEIKEKAGSLPIPGFGGDDDDDSSE